MAQYDINLREYWRILKKRKFIVFITAAALCAFSSFFAYFNAPTPLYTSTCSLKFEKEMTIEGLYAKTLSWTGGDDVDTQISIISSYDIFKEVARRMGLIPATADETDDQVKAYIQTLVENLQLKVEVTRENFTNIILIKATDSNPRSARQLADTIARTYREQHVREQNKKTTEALGYIRDQLDAVRSNLKTAEENFSRFSRENQLVSIDLQGENLLSRVKEIDDEVRVLDRNGQELETLLPRIEDFVQHPDRKNVDLYSNTAGTQYQKTNDQLVELILKRDTLLEDFTRQHPDVLAVSRKIVENARKMGLLLNIEISELEKKKVRLQAERQQVNAKMAVLLDKKLEFNRLKRAVESLQNMTALLEQKNQEALIRKAEKPEEVRIVREALLPAEPINPPRYAATGFMGLLIGLVFGLVLAFVVETFDTSIGAIEDVEETLEAQVLGVIPQADIKEIQESLKSEYPEGIEDVGKFINMVAHFAPKSMIAESLRSLRTNIQFKEGLEQLKTLVVTSTSPKEGKTMVALNLAISLSQAGLKTLLVSADLRKPMISRILGLEIKPGLTDLLLGNYPWRDTVKTITDIIMGKITLDEVMRTPGLDNLHIITCGTIPPNPAELIESGRLKSFIEEAKQEYDSVIFDAPPILSAADAAILGTKADGVLLVYRLGAVSRGLLKRSANQLKQVRCRIVGIVLNGMRPEISPDFQDFKYLKYYYAYREKDEGRGRRGLNKVISLFHRERDRLPATEWREPQEKPSPAPGSSSRGKDHGRLKWLLLLLGLVLLLLGWLWNEKIVDPLSRLGGLTFGETEPGVPPARPQAASPVFSPGKSPEKTVTVRAGEAGQGPLSKPVGPPVQPPPEPHTPGPGKQPAAAVTPVSRPFSLFLGSFRNRERAQKAIDSYLSGGLSPYWTRVDLAEKGMWYRVYAGYFEEEEQARAYQNRHNLPEGQVKRTPYAVRIDGFTPEEGLQKQSDSLKTLGYFPYVIQEGAGTSLLLGAFITRQGAEQLQRDLNQKGIPCRVIMR